MEYLKFQAAIASAKIAKKEKKKKKKEKKRKHADLDESEGL